MSVPIRLVFAGLTLVLAAQSRAQDAGSNPLAAVRANRWADAQAAAARFADPVAEKLVLYMRLRAPGAATAEEIAGLHAAQSGLARAGDAGTPPAGSHRLRSGRRRGAGAVHPTAADFGGRDAALRRGAGQCRPHGRGQCAGPSGLGQRHRRCGHRSGVSAPLGRHRLGGRPVGALPAPRLEQRSGRCPADHPARRQLPCRGRGPPRGQARRPADRAAGVACCPRRCRRTRA